MHAFLKGTPKTVLATLGALALAVPAAAQFGGPPQPPNTGVPLYARMTGGSGFGNVTLVVDPPKGKACYIMNVRLADEVTAAHVHKGAAGETGAPVIPLNTPQGGTSGGCVDIAPELSAALLANPGGYYVNVHTRTFPNGAIRGQLSK